jgi:hypothetical protein
MRIHGNRLRSYLTPRISLSCMGFTTLIGFCASVEITLGNGDEGFVVFHIDEILVFSKSFDEHMVHLETVNGYLTKTGFSSNVAK